MKLRALAIIPCVLALSGCYYYASDVPYYSISVTTDVALSPTFAGFDTAVTATYATNNVAVYLVEHDWSVVSAAGPYVLVDNGFTGTLRPGVAGEYLLRYRAWYYTNYDNCCSASDYRESYVVVTALTPPPG